jgi:hypothetical protein
MSLTDTVSKQIDTAIEMGFTSIRRKRRSETGLGQKPGIGPEVAQGALNRAAGIDAHLDAIRRAGL